MKYQVVVEFTIDADSAKEAKDRFTIEDIDIVREIVGAKKSKVVTIEEDNKGS